jgi:GH35 family endo-1,4-beta-xylanase
MKTKNIFPVLLVVMFLAACAPAAEVVPTREVLPVATATPAPTHTLTLAAPQTLTPAPENISAAEDLPVWVDEFVHAYGGKIIAGSTEVDASQLTYDIRKNSEKYIQTKQVNGAEISYLLVNGIPLALRDEIGVWQEATLARLGDMAGVLFEFSPRIPGDQLSQYISVLKKVAGENARFTFPSEMDTCRIYNSFSPENWKTVVSNWDAIQQDLNTGKVPAGYPYEWQGVYDIMDFARSQVAAPQFRGQHIVETRLNYCMLADSIINLWEAEKFSPADMLKVLEFVVRTRVIQFPEVTSWDVEDEMIAADVVYQTGGGNWYRFWLNATGKTAVELTTLVADWVKKDNPNATTYIVEDAVFDNKNPDAKWEINAFDRYIQGLSNNHARVDKIIVENNLWIYSPPDMEYIAKRIDEFKALGFTIGGSETMIVTGEEAINGNGRAKLVQVTDRNLAQANLFRDLLKLYLSKGITTFGFGGIDDYTAWTNDVGLPDANPLLFDHEFRAKPSYYAIVQVLYEHLP